MSDRADGRAAATYRAASANVAAMHDDPYRYRIVLISSGPVGWAIERDGKIWRTGPRLEVLGAWLDAYLAGASS